jgi:hypothetical protein
MNFSNKYFYFIIVLVLVLSSCIKDVDITTPGQETTIVYGMLDIKNTKHFLRIQKAFLDKNQSALVMAKETDSIYYPNILDVKITDLANGNTYTLNRFYGDTAGILKDTGIFSSSPNILYTFDASLNKDHRYILKVRNTNTNNEAEAQINIANIPKIQFPISNIEIGIVDTVPYTIKWQSAPYGITYDLVVRFNYSEKNLTTGAVTNKVYEYAAFRGASGSNLSGGETIEKKIIKSEIYKRLASSLQVNNNLERTIDPSNTLEFVIYVAGDEYDKYIQIKNAQGGITSVNFLPTYTNINNGLGLLSSRTFVKADRIRINQISRDSLSYGIYTKDLNFTP